MGWKGLEWQGGLPGNEGLEGGNVSFLPLTRGTPSDQSLLLPVMWPCPQPNPALRSQIPGEWGCWGPVPAKKIHGKEAKRGPQQKEELLGARKAAWSELPPTQRPQARDRVSMGGRVGQSRPAESLLSLTKCEETEQYRRTL